MANTLRFKRGLVAGIPTGVAGEPLFTTDTFDLYIGNGTTNTRFQKYIASGTTAQYLRGDGSLATFPTDIVTGTGTTNYLPKFTGASTLGNSSLIDNGTQTGFNNAGQFAFYVSGNFSYAVNGVNVPYFGIASGIETGGSGNASMFISGYDNLKFYTNNLFRARITSGGNFIINSASTDSGQRFQVTGDGYFSGSVTAIGSINVGSAGSLSINAGSAATPLLTQTTNYTEIYRRSGGVGIYLGGTGDAANYYDNTAHYFRTSSGSATRMTLDASGNLGLSVTPSAWISVYRAFNIGTKGFVYSRTDTDETAIGTNWYRNSAANFIYSTNGNASLYSQTTGQHQWFTAISGTAGGTVTFTQQMTLTANGRLLLGSTSDTGELLQVNGTMKVTGVATFSSTYGFAIGSIAANRRIQYGSDLSTAFTLLTDTNSYADLYAASFVPNSSTIPTNGMYLGAANQINFATNSTSRFNIASTGAATFSSSVTAGGTITQTSSSASLFLNRTGGTTYGTEIRYQTSGTNNWAVGTAQATVGTDYSIYNYLVGAGAVNITYATNNVQIGSTTDAGYKLDVNGTMKVTGASTFGSSITAASAVITGDVAIGVNTALRRLHVKSGAGIAQFESNTTSGSIYFGDTGSSTIDNQGIGSRGNSIGIFTSGVDRLTIASTGAATFSSSVTARGNLEVNNLSAGVTVGDFLVDATNKTVYVGRLSSTGGDNSNFIVRDRTNVARVSLGSGGSVDHTFRLNSSNFDIINYGGTTTFFRVANDGAATFSSSVQAATAIAIGTTPDTNKPFKILKNINATVGINFENTSTGSSAFSAIQMGTDVTGGTAFTNLVYGSSGISEAGVYKPSGTSLVNTGSGGLNFLAVSQPIRFFTSSGNGTLRASITNDGDYTQFNGTNPSASTTDAFRMYSADVVAGNAAPHFRTENGAVVKIYQETTAVGNSTISVGGGSAVLDDTQFGGYTLRQVVKALQNQGILA